LSASTRSARTDGTLRAAADRRVASERADALRIAGNQQCFRPQPRGRDGGIEPRVTAADDDHGGIVTR
jgi:hypothetical protein